ncbi:chromatin modification-related protein eaf-1-like isoform X2 [Xenia sp. Carnegie-2017]|uniref:chromatin modification-related protein eaf-1-like isoform X2 n=1 Tax=Xenia sp. Carnegie-2017 TaxID=2897299 RepID=UPI001F036C76|nr:chromatin modification-related protein eaf-1-like isoform X2 [Xenia sp. Carnegie-2017]
MNPNQGQTGQNPTQYAQHYAGYMATAAQNNYYAASGYPGYSGYASYPYYGMTAIPSQVPPMPAIPAPNSQILPGQQDFAKQYEEWKKQYDLWLEQTKNHPDQQQVQQWQQQMQQWEQQMAQMFPQRTSNVPSSQTMFSPQSVNSAPPVASVASINSWSAAAPTVNPTPPVNMTASSYHTQSNYLGSTGQLYGQQGFQMQTQNQNQVQPQQGMQNTVTNVQQSSSNQNKFVPSHPPLPSHQSSQYNTTSNAQSFSENPSNVSWQQSNKLPYGQNQPNSGPPSQPPATSFSSQASNSQHQAYEQSPSLMPRQASSFQATTSGFHAKSPHVGEPPQNLNSWQRGPSPQVRPPSLRGPSSSIPGGLASSRPAGYALDVVRVNNEPRGHPPFPDQFQGSRFSGSRPQGQYNNVRAGNQQTLNRMPLPAQNSGPRMQLPSSVRQPNKQGHQSLMSLNPRTPQVHLDRTRLGVPSSQHKQSTHFNEQAQQSRQSIQPGNVSNERQDPRPMNQEANTEKENISHFSEHSTIPHVPSNEGEPRPRGHLSSYGPRSDFNHQYPREQQQQLTPQGHIQQFRTPSPQPAKHGQYRYPVAKVTPPAFQEHRMLWPRVPQPQQGQEMGQQKGFSSHQGQSLGAPRGATSPHIERMAQLREPLGQGQQISQPNKATGIREPHMLQGGNMRLPGPRAGQPQGLAGQRMDQPRGPPGQRMDQPIGLQRSEIDQPRGTPGPKTDQPRGPPAQRMDQPRGPLVQRLHQAMGPSGQRMDSPSGPPAPRLHQLRSSPGHRMNQPRGPSSQRMDQPRGSPAQRMVQPQRMLAPRLNQTRGPFLQRMDQPRGPLDKDFLNQGDLKD